MMAVAMDHVAWRMELGKGGGSAASPAAMENMKLGGKKRAWGADTEKLMHLMMGQFACASPSGVQEVAATLDLLGIAAGPSVVRAPDSDCTSAGEFLELRPDQPLPCGWEKCLDLKTGKSYFVNKATGLKTSEDPRTPSRPQAHEFLSSKRDESLRTNSSGTSSGGTSNSQLLSFSTGKQLWNLQLNERRTVSLTKTGSSARFPNSSDEEGGEELDSTLELDLNLSSSPRSPPPPPSPHSQGVCTMEMVERALKRTEKAMGKREMASTSSLFSSVIESWSQSASQSTSTSSSASSRSGHHAVRSSTPGVCEAESRKDATPTGALVMGACTSCLMYVMLSKSDPKCPRCEREVPVDFSSPPSSKKLRVSRT